MSSQSVTGHIFGRSKGGYSPESTVALLTAYTTLRDRYNQQRKEIRRLQLHLKNECPCRGHVGSGHINAKKTSHFANGDVRPSADVIECRLNIIENDQNLVGFTPPQAANAADLIREFRMVVEKFENLLQEKPECVSDPTTGEAISLSLEALLLKFQQANPLSPEQHRYREGIMTTNSSSSSPNNGHVWDTFTSGGSMKISGVLEEMVETRQDVTTKSNGPEETETGVDRPTYQGNTIMAKQICEESEVDWTSDASMRLDKGNIFTNRYVLRLLMY